MATPRNPILFFLCCAFLALLTACGKYRTADLSGHWRAVELIENRELTTVPDTLRIGFDFGPGSKYTFNGALNYREAGTYRVLSNYVYFTDKSREKVDEKAVEIVSLANDTLTLKMEEDNRTQTLRLVRPWKITPAPVAASNPAPASTPVPSTGISGKASLAVPEAPDTDGPGKKTVKGKRGKKESGSPKKKSGRAQKPTKKSGKAVKSGKKQTAKSKPKPRKRQR